MASTFTYCVPPNSFRTENAAASNAAALSYANSKVWSARFCLGDIAAGGCVNSVYASVIAITGPGTPTSIGIVSGQLPPGISLSSTMLSGIFTTPGTYTFSVRAADSSGNFAQRDYTITVAEIVTVVLPDGDTSTPYAQAIVTNGFNDPVYTIAGGALPAGITLHPATGVLSGTATESGDFNFVVQVQDTNATCLQDYALTIGGGKITAAYWKLDGPTLGNTDSVSAQALFVNNFGSVLSSPPAIISNGFNMAGGFCNLSQSSQQFLYTGTGWTWAAWVRWSSAGTGAEGMQWVFCSATPQNFIWTIGNGEYHFLYDGINELTGNTPILAADVFHFVAFRYDPATGKLGYSFDGAAFVDLPGNAGVMSVNPEVSPYGLLGNENSLWDEVGYFLFPFSAADLAYIYNAGAGRTYPFTFPP